jgi:hypothetical protein
MAASYAKKGYADEWMCGYAGKQLAKPQDRTAILIN